MINENITISTEYSDFNGFSKVFCFCISNYCQEAQCELLKKIGINDQFLDSNDIMLLVKSLNIEYEKLIEYGEELTIKTSIPQISEDTLDMNFKIYNDENIIVSKAKMTIAFYNGTRENQIKIPNIVKQKFTNYTAKQKKAE